AIGMFSGIWFLVCLGFPAVRWITDRDPFSYWSDGFDEFMSGFLGIFYAQPAWYANPFIIIAVALLILDKTLHWALCLAAMLLAPLAMFEYGRTHCLGACTTTVGFGPGYYLWVALTVFLTAVSAIDQEMKARG
ncbi:MAG: hypothetical protein J0H61_10125, partial [Alphaproteobacteria bacterium]|nr:hypothetical protein [Alphaproteobacteria bacterium]